MKVRVGFTVSFWVLAVIFGRAGLSIAGTDSSFGGIGANEKMLFTHWTNQLSDSTRSPKTKIEAAEGLLTRDYPEAEKAIVGFLDGSAGQAAQIAVAQAIANRGEGKIGFVKPLLAMLTDEEVAIQTPAAHALATYRLPEVADKIVSITLDRKQEHRVRLATLVALERMLDKRAVDGLVRLLDDPDLTMSKAAQESLAKLTNVRGMDKMDWKTWWRKNKNKPRDKWLADLTESLVQAKIELESENATLRAKLALTTRDLYHATPAGRQDALLSKMLSESLTDVRLIGIDMLDLRISENTPVSDDIRRKIRSLIGDKSPAVRASSALLVARLGDSDSLKALLGGLKDEESSEVIVAMLKAVGQLRDPLALDAVLKRVSSATLLEVEAASGAIARIAQAKPLEKSLQTKTAKALITQYATLSSGRNHIIVRESILSAMAVVADKSFIKIMTNALTDEDASIRRAAVTGLGQINGSIQSDILEPFTADQDHGVRQAAIVALGKRNSQRHLKVILQRGDPKIESQAAVRTQAWNTAMAILADAKTQTLAEALDILTGRTDCPDLQIKIMVSYVDKLREEKSPKLPLAQQQLAKTLLLAGRPAQAAKHLDEAYKTLIANNDSSVDKNDQAGDVWQLLIEAMLLANNPAAVDLLATQKTHDAFSEGITRLQSRLTDLTQGQEWDAVITLAKQCLLKLEPLITPAEVRDLTRQLGLAQTHRLGKDTEKITKLISQLSNGDATVISTGKAEIISMGTRATKPLLIELKNAIGSQKSTAKIEEVIVDILGQVAPKLTGYDKAASKKARLVLIEKWLGMITDS